MTEGEGGNNGERDVGDDGMRGGMNVVIAAGGTGGHVFPAVAVAEALCRRDPATAVTVVGTGRALESMMMEGRPWKTATLAVRGVVGRGWKAAVSALLMLPGAVWRSVRVLRAAKATLVIGTGGYTSPPVVAAAALLGVRRVMIEPNAVPGIANRAMAPLAHRIFVSCAAAAEWFPAGRVMVAGTPVREAFAGPPPDAGSGRIATMLVCGGSQGAKAVNAAVVEAVEASALIRERVTVVHQAGAAEAEHVAREYRRLGVAAEVTAFIEDMAGALRRADLVISRCGASALAEIAACGRPSILIPFPQATHDHQAGNARVVEQAGAAVVLLQAALTGAGLARVIEELWHDPARVRRMAERSAELRKTDAAAVMAEECCRLAAGARG